MAYDINADSYPDYDDWGYDEYWKLTEWQTFYDKLIQKCLASSNLGSKSKK